MMCVLTQVMEVFSVLDWNAANILSGLKQTPKVAPTFVHLKRTVVRSINQRVIQQLLKFAHVLRDFTAHGNFRAANMAFKVIDSPVGSVSRMNHPFRHLYIGTCCKGDITTFRSDLLSSQVVIDAAMKTPQCFSMRFVWFYVAGTASIYARAVVVARAPGHQVPTRSSATHTLLCPGPPQLRAHTQLRSSAAPQLRSSAAPQLTPTHTHTQISNPEDVSGAEPTTANFLEFFGRNLQ